MFYFSILSTLTVYFIQGRFQMQCSEDMVRGARWNCLSASQITDRLFFFSYGQQSQRLTMNGSKKGKYLKTAVGGSQTI